MLLLDCDEKKNLRFLYVKSKKKLLWNSCDRWLVVEKKFHYNSVLEAKINLKMTWHCIFFSSTWCCCGQFQFSFHCNCKCCTVSLENAFCKDLQWRLWVTINFERQQIPTFLFTHSLSRISVPLSLILVVWLLLLKSFFFSLFAILFDIVCVSVLPTRGKS